MNVAKMIAAATVMQPATATERLLMAPSISPISMAFAVPITCEAVPMATPLAMGCFTPVSLQMISPAMLPNSPVRMIEATVIDT